MAEHGRAMQSRCFWPPETFTPPWSSQVSKPSGMASMKSRAWAFFAACLISSSVGSARP